jgi:hypothetical protein
MRVLPPIEQEIRRAIRDARAKDPLIPVTKLQETLERQFNRQFSRPYLTKLSVKVAREAPVEVDRIKIEERMSHTRENYRLMHEELLKIVYWRKEDGPPYPRAADKVEAAKSVAMLDLAILKAEIERGLYKSTVLRCLSII